jgi:hypothetical protein
MVVMNTRDDELTAISGWTDDEIAQDHLRAASVLYAAAALEQLSLIELVERLNELNQNKMLSIGAGEASNLLHEFWDSGYKRMPQRRRAATFAQVLGATEGEQPDANERFPALWPALVTPLAAGDADEVAAAAGALRDNLAEHVDEQAIKAAIELRTTISQIVAVLSDLELRTAYKADDMWQVVEAVQREFGGELDVQRARTLAGSGAQIIGQLEQLADGTPDPELVAAAQTWLSADDAGS